MKSKKQKKADKNIKRLELQYKVKKNLSYAKFAIRFWQLISLLLFITLCIILVNTYGK